MIRLVTNCPQYFNDIAEEIRLFVGMEEITGEETACSHHFEINLFDNCAVGRELYSVIGSSVDYSVDLNDPLDLKRQQKRAVKLVAFNILKQLFNADTPWGSLTGIRPTKLFRELCQRLGEQGAEQEFLNTYSVSKPKLALAKQINAIQAPFIQSVSDRDVDIYLGIPYCKSRCLYCSFGSEVARQDGSLDEYAENLKCDIAHGAALVKERGLRVRALYFGGGTPTVLSAAKLDEVLSYALSCYGGYGDEFTVEAGRPDTITYDMLAVLKNLGVTRISVNPQSMNDATLKLVGRLHSSKDILDCFSMVKGFGFESINMDVIAGLMGEGCNDFEHTLNCIGQLRPDNLTVHTLAIKRSSRLKQALEQYPLTPPEVVKEMIDMGMAAAKDMGMVPYYMYRQKYMQGNLENVGYALPNKVCTYNIDMMEETVSILAHGAGAMTKRVFLGENRVERIPNPKDVKSYFNKLNTLFDQKNRLF